MAEKSIRSVRLDVLCVCVCIVRRRQRCVDNCIFGRCASGCVAEVRRPPTYRVIYLFYYYYFGEFDLYFSFRLLSGTH